MSSLVWDIGLLFYTLWAISRLTSKPCHMGDSLGKWVFWPVHGVISVHYFIALCALVIVVSNVLSVKSYINSRRKCMPPKAYNIEWKNTTYYHSAVQCLNDGSLFEKEWHDVVFIYHPWSPLITAAGNS